MFTLEEANEFLLKIPKIPAKLKPNFHFIAKHGWINDPYGIIFYEGEYHVFYQYHPFSAINGDMSWGHLVTKDFVSFKEKKVAIAPDKFYDNTGCWSGSVLVKDNKIYLFYTGFSKHDDGKFYLDKIADSYTSISVAEYKITPAYAERNLEEWNFINGRWRKIIK